MKSVLTTNEKPTNHKFKNVLTTNEKSSNSQELRLTGKTQRTVQSHGLTTRLSKGSIRLGAFRYVKTEEEASVTQ